MGTTPTTIPPPFRRGPQCFSDLFPLFCFFLNHDHSRSYQSHPHIYNDSTRYINFLFSGDLCGARNPGRLQTRRLQSHGLRCQHFRQLPGSIRRQVAVGSSMIAEKGKTSTPWRRRRWLRRRRWRRRWRWRWRWRRRKHKVIERKQKSKHQNTAELYFKDGTIEISPWSWSLMHLSIWSAFL